MLTIRIALGKFVERLGRLGNGVDGEHGTDATNETYRSHWSPTSHSTITTHFRNARSKECDMKSRFVLGSIVLAFAVLTAGTILLGLNVREPTAKFVEALRAQGNVGLVWLALAYTPTSLLFFPAPLLTITGGFVFGVVKTVVAVSLGSTLAASITFLAGRTLLRRFIEHKVAGDARFQALDQAVADQGFKIVFLTRLSPVLPYNLLNYAFGLTRVRFRDYVLASWIGMLPGTILYVSIGAAAQSLTEITSGRPQGGTAQKVFFGCGLLATVIVSVLLTRIAKKALTKATVAAQE